jgi:hypothetical protein
VVIILSDSVNLSTFPKNKDEALALLYTQNQDLKGKTVKEIAQIYYNAYYEFHYQTREIEKEALEKFRKDQTWFV